MNKQVLSIENEARKIEDCRTHLSIIDSITIVLEALYLRHNLSAVLRTAEAFGVQDVHLVSKGRPVEHGVARGAEKWVTLHTYETIDTCLFNLKNQGFSIFVADLTDESFTPETIPVDRKVAVLFGSELAGVSERAKELADGTIIVPMVGLTQSLNVSVAAACIIGRVSARRRHLIGSGDLTPARKAKLLTDWQNR